MDNLKGGTATMYDVSKGYEAAKEFYANRGIARRLLQRNATDSG